MVEHMFDKQKIPASVLDIAIKGSQVEGDVKSCNLRILASQSRHCWPK